MSKRVASRALGVCLAMAAGPPCFGCQEELEPAGHLRLYIDTDAPLPLAPGQLPEPDRPFALFDSVRVDLYPAGAVAPCAGCSREFELDQETVNRGASFTVSAEPGSASAAVARIRLFRGPPLGPEPPPGSSVELWLQLPPLPVEGELALTAFLPTDALGVPLGSLSAPQSPLVGWTGSGHAGSWPPAQRVPCRGQPQAGEVCVPGGAYWMGDRTLVGFDLTIETHAERLVVISPFFMDEKEVTVAEYRAAGGQGARAWSGSHGPFFGNLADYCNFTSLPNPAQDGLPVNCLPPLHAAAYCDAQGKRLPSEAEFEYAAGALASREHPWGSDEPSCGDAVWGRLGPVPNDPSLTGACYQPSRPTLPEALFDAAGQPRPGRDRVELDGGTIYDLAGNVSEWCGDVANEIGEACWPTSGSQIFVDPLCGELGVQGGQHMFRGGNFVMASYWTRAAARRTGHASPETGFRCVRPDSGPPGPLDCTGMAEDFEDSCARCLEQKCCGELLADARTLGTEVDGCVDARCASECVLEIAIECAAPPPPAAQGGCVTLSGGVMCNPVTNAGCAGGAACDEVDGGFTCFDPPNDVDVCGACDSLDGPFCRPGSTCILGSYCAKYCCEDADCAPGVCFKGDGGPLFNAAPGVGICVER